MQTTICGECGECGRSTNKCPIRPCDACGLRSHNLQTSRLCPERVRCHCAHHKVAAEGTTKCTGFSKSLSAFRLHCNKVLRVRNSRHQRAHPQLATEWATQGSDRFQPAGRPKDWIPRRTDRTWLPRSARCRWAGPPRGSLQTTVRPQPRPLHAADHPTGATHGRSPHERHTRPTAPLLPVYTDPSHNACGCRFLERCS
jgi:hypothetical protein